MRRARAARDRRRRRARPTDGAWPRAWCCRRRTRSPARARGAPSTAAARARARACSADRAAPSTTSGGRWSAAPGRAGRLDHGDHLGHALAHRQHALAGATAAAARGAARSPDGSAIQTASAAAAWPPPAATAARGRTGGEQRHDRARPPGGQHRCRCLHAEPGSSRKPAAERAGHGAGGVGEIQQARAAATAGRTTSGRSRWPAETSAQPQRGSADLEQHRPQVEPELGERAASRPERCKRRGDLAAMGGKGGGVGRCQPRQGRRRRTRPTPRRVRQPAGPPS